MRQRSGMIVNKKTADTPNAAAPRQTPNQTIGIRDPIKRMFASIDKERNRRTDISAKHGEARLARIKRF